ncbi:MAG: hypothetical protein KGD60_14155 [Candidatus Thorarchaeota archaeon]|nr:hypothetical protein [Candidatus Thorarchaeota archaeon]
MNNHTIKEFATDMTERALVSLAKLLLKHGILDQEDVDNLVSDLNPEFDEIYAEEMKHKQPGVFTAANFKVEYDPHVLECDTTYAFEDEAIIILRVRREGT